MDDSNPLRALRKGELPRMVAWYDPRLLARVGVRTMVSSVFGQYADQRLIQAATDNSDNGDVVNRYDFRDPTPDDPMRRIDLDGDGAYWIDYIADTGDGFESTYGMAYLLAQEQLNVRGTTAPLPYGDILIMGGDQCYPQATREEYKKRLLTPFEWAFDVAEPQRKLFAIPGNHDWYDGLAAFDSLFCSSRDRLSKSKGNAIGGWQCQQHRSYWALRLPYNWWIWGCDIQFSQYLDLAQVNYFAQIAEHMGPDDKVILCIAEPSWLIADLHGEDEEQNFFKITALARSRGARVCAVIAGDWHHYNRYYQPELDVHFFTAGGGGAFLHPTHVLRNEISVRWPQEETADDVSATSRPLTPGGGRWKAQDYDIRLGKAKVKGKPNAKDIVADVGKAVQNVGDAVQETVIDPIIRETGGGKPRKPNRPLKPMEPKCYPEKWTSILLSLRNLWFPLYNKWFAAGIGMIYWLVTWQFSTLVTQHDISVGKIDSVGVATSYWSVLRFMPLYLTQAALVSISFVAMIAGLYAALIWYVSAPEKPRWKHILTKFGVGTAHFLAHLTAMFALGLLFIMLNNWMSPPIEKWVNETWRNREAGIVREVLNETLEPLTSARQTQRETYKTDRQQQQAAGAVKSAPPPAAAMTGVTANTQSAQFRQLLGFILYPIEMIFIGGMVGGFLWGLYWVVTGILGRMHAEDAFAALRIKDYKNFLRLKFERDQLTIYPIGLDRMPRHGDWSNRRKDVPPTSSNSWLVPVRPIDTRLIEAPIVIKAHPPSSS